MKSVPTNSKICISCNECCKWITFIIPKMIAKKYEDYYKARGCQIIYQGWEVAILVPSKCPHLDRDGTCKIYKSRPQACKDYDGRKDPYLNDLCKLKDKKECVK